MKPEGGGFESHTDPGAEYVLVVGEEPVYLLGTAYVPLSKALIAWSSDCVEDSTL